MPVTITFTRYDEPNWLIIETLESLSKQIGINATILFLDQRDDGEIQSIIETFNTENLNFIRELIPAKSLSYARNTAIKKSAYDQILFIDSDAVAKPDWAANMTDALLREDIGIVGGRIFLKWHKRPLLLARARVVKEQYSGLDLGTAIKETQKVVGASFAINRNLLGSNAYFDENLGRREGILLGGEETDLCNRAQLAGLKVLYQGSAVVDHQVLPERITYSWIFKRIFYAGYGRAQSGGQPSPSHQMGVWDYLFIPIILPFYIAGFIKQKFFK